MYYKEAQLHHEPFLFFCALACLFDLFAPSLVYSTAGLGGRGGIRDGMQLGPQQDDDGARRELQRRNMNEPFSLINSTILVQVVVPHNGLMSLECLQTL